MLAFPATRVYRPVFLSAISFYRCCVIRRSCSFNLYAVCETCTTNGGRGGVVVRLLSSHLGESGSITSGDTPGFFSWESRRNMSQDSGFSRGSPVSPALVRAERVSRLRALSEAGQSECLGCVRSPKLGSASVQAQRANHFISRAVGSRPRILIHSAYGEIAPHIYQPTPPPQPLSPSQLHPAYCHYLPAVSLPRTQAKSSGEDNRRQFAERDLYITQMQKSGADLLPRFRRRQLLRCANGELCAMSGPSVGSGTSAAAIFSGGRHRPPDEAATLQPDTSLYLTISSHTHCIQCSEPVDLGIPDAEGCVQSRTTAAITTPVSRGPSKRLATPTAFLMTSSRRLAGDCSPLTQDELRAHLSQRLRSCIAKPSYSKASTPTSALNVVRGDSFSPQQQLFTLLTPNSRRTRQQYVRQASFANQRLLVRRRAEGTNAGRSNQSDTRASHSQSENHIKGTATPLCLRLLVWQHPRATMVRALHSSSPLRASQCSLAALQLAPTWGFNDQSTTEQRRIAKAGETGDARENSPISGVVRHDNHVRKSRSYPAGNRTPIRHCGSLQATSREDSDWSRHDERSLAGTFVMLAHLYSSDDFRKHFYFGGCRRSLGHRHEDNLGRGPAGAVSDLQSGERLAQIPPRHGHRIPAVGGCRGWARGTSRTTVKLRVYLMVHVCVLGAMSRVLSFSATD
ncbi:hypothetical protein PR048_002399 [Dryococelus australis]|uniref:Uncharacterized protein n=1 Tax=Dryococelus australis TaxID=614101 RepID=A0ABQ9IMJ3_9NEOP|nr:hypothetical protein PR048_002399 [Dryococelus australis]